MQRLTDLNKEIHLICCFNFCIFIQWPASIKLLIMFLFFFFILIKSTFVLKLYLPYFIILALHLLYYVCIKLIEVS